MAWLEIMVDHGWVTYLKICHKLMRNCSCLLETARRLLGIRAYSHSKARMFRKLKVADVNE